jgi:hypothetical protein
LPCDAGVGISSRCAATAMTAQKAAHLLLRLAHSAPVTSLTPAFAGTRLLDRSAAAVLVIQAAASGKGTPTKLHMCSKRPDKYRVQQGASVDARREARLPLRSNCPHRGSPGERCMRARIRHKVLIRGDNHCFSLPHRAAVFPPCSAASALARF